MCKYKFKRIYPSGQNFEKKNLLMFKTQNSSYV